MCRLVCRAFPSEFAFAQEVNRSFFRRHIGVSRTDDAWLGGALESKDAVEVAAGGADVPDIATLSKEYSARVDELAQHLKQQIAFHNVLKNTYVRLFFLKAPDAFLDYQRSQLEKCLEFLFAVTDVSNGIDRLDLETLRYVHC